MGLVYSSLGLGLSPFGTFEVLSVVLGGLKATAGLQSLFLGGGRQRQQKGVAKSDHGVSAFVSTM